MERSRTRAGRQPPLGRLRGTRGAGASPPFGTPLAPSPDARSRPDRGATHRAEAEETGRAGDRHHRGVQRHRPGDRHGWPPTPGPASSSPPATATALTEVASGINADGGAGDRTSPPTSAAARTCERVADAAVDRFGGFDTWVNNAGMSIFGPARGGQRRGPPPAVRHQLLGRRLRLARRRCRT